MTEFAGKIYLEHRYENIEKAFQRTTDIIGISFDEYIRLLINGDYELYDLIGIYSVQLFRTKKMRGRYSEVMKTVYSSQEGGDPQKLTEVQRDSLIKCILFIDAISFTYDMTGTEFSIEFLRSMEGESFLTSNSPALHYSAHGESLTSLEDFEGFMPLTPKIALLIRGCKPTGNNLNVRGVFNHEVLQWNSKIILEADDEIYSTKEIDGAMLS
ncbi:DUF4238 domain-containing protein [Shewanella algae]|uniref:DUF4238 domain-containing protein n=1 Tax=Shewanella algae TaxID=38313 RepID=UPI0031F4EA26